MILQKLQQNKFLSIVSYIIHWCKSKTSEEIQKSPGTDKIPSGSTIVIIKKKKSNLRDTPLLPNTHPWTWLWAPCKRLFPHWGSRHGRGHDSGSTEQLTTMLSMAWNGRTTGTPFQTWSARDASRRTADWKPVEKWSFDTTEITSHRGASSPGAASHWPTSCHRVPSCFLWGTMWSALKDQLVLVPNAEQDFTEGLSSWNRNNAEVKHAQAPAEFHHVDSLLFFLFFFNQQQRLQWSKITHVRCKEIDLFFLSWFWFWWLISRMHLQICERVKRCRLFIFAVP